MNDAAVPPGYVPRGEGRDKFSRALAGVRGLERERRMRRLVTIFMGWGMAAFMTLVALACLAVLWARPAPRDRYYVAMMHDDGTYEAPQLREDLPASQREVIEMLKVAGMSLEEVARATSSTVGSVKQRVHRAYKRLREKMLTLQADRRKKGALS